MVGFGVEILGTVGVNPAAVDAGETGGGEEAGRDVIAAFCTCWVTREMSSIDLSLSRRDRHSTSESCFWETRNSKFPLV